MTRKQYVKKIRQFQRNAARHAKEYGLKAPKSADRIPTPKWGTIVPIGSHKGERLSSYAQTWDIISEMLKGTTLLEGIE